MSAKDFIFDWLAEVSQRFQTADFKYVFDSDYNQHVIEVTPNSEYNSDEFAEEQIDFEKIFFRNFPEDEILFVSENHGLNLPPFEFEFPSEWLDVEGWMESCLFDCVNDLKPLIKKVQASPTTAINWNDDILKNFPLNVNFANSVNEGTIVDSDNQWKTDNIIPTPFYEGGEENDYSLAA